MLDNTMVSYTSNTTYTRASSTSQAEFKGARQTVILLSLRPKTDCIWSLTYYLDQLFKMDLFSCVASPYDIYKMKSGSKSRSGSGSRSGSRSGPRWSAWSSWCSVTLENLRILPLPSPDHHLPSLYSVFIQWYIILDFVSILYTSSALIYHFRCNIWNMMKILWKFQSAKSD